MKMRMKKLMSVLCAAALFGSLLAGCGSAETTSSITESVTGEEAYVSAEAEIEVEEDFEFEFYHDFDTNTETSNSDYAFLTAVTSLALSPYFGSNMVELDDEEREACLSALLEVAQGLVHMEDYDGADGINISDGTIDGVDSDVVCCLWFTIGNEATDYTEGTTRIWFYYDDGSVYQEGLGGMKKITNEKVLAVVDEIYEKYKSQMPNMSLIE